MSVLPWVSGCPRCGAPHLVYTKAQHCRRCGFEWGWTILRAFAEFGAVCFFVVSGLWVSGGVAALGLAKGWQALAIFAYWSYVPKLVIGPGRKV